MKRLLQFNLAEFDHNVKFKLDSGAQVNTMPRNVYSKFASMQNLQSSNSLLRTSGGSPINSFGTVLLKCKHGDVVKNHLFYVVDNLLPPLLGLKTCLSMDLLKILCPVKPETPLECNSLLDAYFDVFKGIGCLAQPYTILTDNNVTPVRFSPRRIPFALTDKVKAKPDSMIAQYVVEPVNEHPDWVNSIVITSKKNGDVRICLDPRPLNKAIKRQYHPTRLPKLDVIADNILLWADTKEETLENIRKTLDRCREVGIRLNLAKCKFCE